MIESIILDHIVSYAYVFQQSVCRRAAWVRPYEVMYDKLVGNRRVGESH